MQSLETYGESNSPSRLYFGPEEIDNTEKMLIVECRECNS
ncbi:hypothetical protein BH18THE2_BH18THE2_35660 [soil metagenome]